ncbi:MAG: methyltransferase domain-containing protein [Methanomassiliicoccales archaeon]|jgi:trans-aconitate methyltransferase|nr:methyltransferase domain-containing protein [Methanomassiliicoccales archaeon]
MPGPAPGKGYGFDAERYRAWSRPQREWGERLISSLHLQGDERVLDIGCGEGTLTARIASLVPKGSVLGMDASSSMVGLAKGLEASNLEFVVMDASRMGFEGEFDLVFSNAALHWVLDHRDLLARVCHALRPGGRSRLNFAGEGNCSNLFRVEREEMASEEFAVSFEGFVWPWFMPRPEDHRRMLSEAGFTDIQVEGQVADRHFTTEELVNWIDHPSIVPLLEWIGDPAMSQRFRDRVVHRMVEETRTPDGRHFETFRRVDSSARR